MIEKIMKTIKSSNKRRGRNITVETVVGFLLSCIAVMGADNYLWIRENNGAIEFNTQKTTEADGSDGSWDTTNPYEEITWNAETNTYTNNMILSSSDVNGKDTNGDLSYGLRLSGNLTNVNFVNNGSITGIITSSGNGYGIYNSGTMGNIENTGIIRGNGAGNRINGYGIYNESAKIGNITNIGIISGTSTTSSSSPSGSASGYGIYNYLSPMGNITNTGIIRGIGAGTGNSGCYGYGIHKSDSLKKENITNTGIISGSGTSTSSSGYGIYSSSAKIGNVTNAGVIYGKDNAIYNTSGNNIDTVNNYGILLNGKNKDVNVGITSINNYGLIIKNGSEIVDKDTVKEVAEEKIKEYNDDGTVKSERKMTIKNKKVTDGSEWFTGNENDSILNALTNTYKVTGENDNVTGSIINAYGTAVVFEGTDKKLTLSGTIVNGGIDNSAAISGSSNGDTLILQSGEIKYTDNGVEKSITQNTIVNGNINMGGGADTLTIGDGTIINGILDGGDSASKDTLNFGISSVTKSNSSDSQEINIMHNISNFENININTNVTLFEKTINASGAAEELKVTGTEKITIESNGTLTLRIDGTNGNSHALSSNTGGVIESNGGKLLLALNGVSDGSTIDIVMSLGDGLYGVENTDIEYRDLFTLETTSILHSVSKNEQDNTKVTVTTKSTLPLSQDTPKDVNYEKLNKIYQSMRVVDGVKEFNVEAEKLSIFLGYLNDIYAGNPYSYSSELSRKSVGMFRDIATENQFKPELNKWLIIGGLTHVDGGTKDTYYGKGYYTYDIGSSDMDADTKITGAYILGEYGVSDTLTYGVLIGGNKLKSDLSNGSKVDGDALYMGAYAKKYVGNLKVTGGLGLQYGDYDADRIAVNKVASSLAEPVMKYSDNYNDMTYDIYLNGRYSHNIGNNLFLEPYGTLSYTYIKQDSADEGSKVLAIETDSKSFDYTAAKVGVDLKKVIPHEKGKSTLSAGVSYTRLLTGADEENITGRFKGGSDFDILVAHKNEHSIGLNAKYTLELESGILFDVKGSYNVERDSHNGSGKNRAKGEWIVGAGIGYKF